jgi:hypothetical protein
VSLLLTRYQILEEQVMPEYGKVRLFFKHLPLKSIHPWAEGAALATECAGDQSSDGFWKMYHAIFKGQRELNQDNLKAKVSELAKSAGLDEAKFTQCYDGKTALPRIEKDLAEAAAVGANSTDLLHQRPPPEAQPPRTSRPYSTKSSVDLAAVRRVETLLQGHPHHISWRTSSSIHSLDTNHRPLVPVNLPH